MATGGLARSESVGLLVPVTIWLTLTFIVPQLTGNLNPTAAINPIAALAAPPDTAFFGAMGQVLGSVSLADAYKFGAANLLDLLPAGIASPAIIPPVAVLVLALMATIAVTWHALTALVTGAIALRTDVATYEAAKASLLALGKSADAIAAPEFYPLRLLRGAIEQIEIIGAAIAILIGYRSASAERGRQTLALMMTRPMRAWQFVSGKALAGIGLLAGGLAVVLGVLAITLHFVSGIGLGPDDRFTVRSRISTLARSKAPGARLTGLKCPPVAKRTSIWTMRPSRVTSGPIRTASMSAVRRPRPFREHWPRTVLRR